jgi:hypothetical protein
VHEYWLRYRTKGADQLSGCLQPWFRSGEFLEMKETKLQSENFRIILEIAGFSIKYCRVLLGDRGIHN